MAKRPQNVVQAAVTGTPTDSTGPISSAVLPELPLLRFRLRHLLLFVAAVSVLLAGIVSLHGIPALALLLAALVVTFHVLGTALGSELRLRAGRSGTYRIAPIVRSSVTTLAADHATRCREMTQTQSPWYGRSGASFKWLPRLVAAAVFIGACVGGLFLTAAIGNRTSIAGLVVGTMSLAALSGWLAFLAGSFYGIVRHGLREAVAEDERNQARHPVPR